MRQLSLPSSKGYGQALQAAVASLLWTHLVVPQPNHHPQQVHQLAVAEEQHVAVDCCLLAGLTGHRLQSAVPEDWVARRYFGAACLHHTADLEQPLMTLQEAALQLRPRFVVVHHE